MTIKCLDCDAELKMPKDTIAGEIVTCSDCGENFEIKDAMHEVLVKAEIIGEDWGQ